MNIGELTATLGIDTKGFDRGIGRAHKSLFTLKNTIAALGIGALAYKLNSMTKHWEQLYKVQEQAEAGLKQAMISMGRYTEATYKGYLDLARALQRTTTFGDEAVISGMKMLMTYRDIGENVIPRAVKAMADLSALTGRDMVASANLLGRASMGLTGELRRVGITVDKVVYKQRGFLGLLEQIESQVGGQAAALARTKSGGMEQYLNIVSDLKERLGSLTLDMKMEFVPVLRDIVIQMSDWMDEQKKLQDLGLPNWFDNMAKSAKRLADVLGTIVKYSGAIADSMFLAIPIYKQLDKYIDKLTETKPKRTIISIYGPPMAEEGLGLGPRPKYEGFMEADYWNYMAESAEKNLKRISDMGNQTFRQDLAEAVHDWGGSFTDMLNDMAWGADVTFNDILKSFGMMITRMVIQIKLVQPWLNWFAGIIGGGPPPVGTFGGEGYMPGFAWAKGAAFQNGRLLAFDRGGIVNRPTIFPMQGGAGLMGEAGPEGVLPLKRMPGGDLGVMAQGGNPIYYINFAPVCNDAKSFVDMARRNPEAIFGPLMKVREMGVKI